MTVAFSIPRSQLLTAARSREIHGLAEDFLRQTLGIVPPINVAKLSAEKCAILRRVIPLEESCEGWLDTRGQQKQLVLNATKPYYRRRFTEAHELGHFLLHDFGNVLHRDCEETVFGAYLGQSDVVREELEASEFAAGLLMPRSGIEQDVGKMPAELSRKYQVSESALVQRLFRLVPSPCFQGEAFLNSGKIIFAYPSLVLEETMPYLADAAWQLNRAKTDPDRAFLPHKSLRALRGKLSRGEPSPRQSDRIGRTDWSVALPVDMSGWLTLICEQNTDTTYFRFEADSPRPGGVR